MTPAISEVAPPLQDTRPPRLLLVSFDGTWDSSLGNIPETAVSEFPSLIAKEENVDNNYRKGVGTTGGPIEQAIDGALGNGVMTNVLEAFMKLTYDYQVGDKIVVVGFSRGAFTARVFAELTSLVGLIKTENVSGIRKTEFYQTIREGLVSGSLWDNIDVLEGLRDRYDFRDNVSIDALCLFDTVASLGVPKVGAGAYIAPILRLVPLFRKDYPDLKGLSVAHPKVRHIFQAISIHESRATYHEQVAQQQSSVSNQVLKQMWFLGNHSDMARNTGYSGFADAPLAWMIGQLQHYLHLRFDEGKLHKRFRSYSESMNLGRPISGAASTSTTANNSSTTIAHVQTVGTVGTPLPCWIQQDIKVFNAFKMFCHGWNQRTPGRYGDRTFEEAHITIRLRGFGRKKADLVMIPGYEPIDIAGKWVWFRLPSWRSKFLRWITNNKIPTALPFISEGEMLPLEAALLGFVVVFG